MTEPRESETYFIDRDLNRVRADKAYRYILENPKTPLAGFTLYLTQPSQMRVEPNFDGAALSDIVTLLRKTGLGFQASSPTTHEDLSKNLSQYLKKFGLETPVINQLCDQITHKVSLESTESAEP